MSPSVTLSGLCCLLAALSAHSQELLYKKIGDSVVLSPDLSSGTDPVTSIVWVHQSDFAMKWDRRETRSYRQFKDRGNLNNSTGELIVTGLTTDDSGVYTVEINGKVNRQTHLKVIALVYKPKIFIWCDEKLSTCVLSCGGDLRAAEPITFTWMKDDETMIEKKEFEITKKQDFCNKQFSCRLENPVSMESSDPISNPLIPNPVSKAEQIWIPVVVVVVVILMITVAVVLIVKYRQRKAVLKPMPTSESPQEEQEMQTPLASNTAYMDQVIDIIQRLVAEHNASSIASMNRVSEMQRAIEWNTESVREAVAFLQVPVASRHEPVAFTQEPEASRHEPVAFTQEPEETQRLPRLNTGYSFVAEQTRYNPETNSLHSETYSYHSRTSSLYGPPCF